MRLCIGHGWRVWLSKAGLILASSVCVCAVGFTQIGLGAQRTTSNAGPEARAAAVHRETIVVDTHCDTPTRMVGEHFDLGGDAGLGHWDLKRAEAGGLGAEFFSIFVEPTTNRGHYARQAMDMIDAVYRAAETHPDVLVMAFSPADIMAARRGPHKRIAALLGLEGGHAIEGDLGVLRDFYRLGVRYMTLTWARSNELGQSSGDLAGADRGLTPFGRDVIHEMNRLGMMVDVSHVSDQSFYDALAATRAPVIASHSSARALTDSSRNLSDEMLRALARNGGVVQVNFNCAFIDQNYLNGFRKLLAQKGATLDAMDDRFNRHEIGYNEYMRELRSLTAGIPRPPFGSLIDHIEHVAKVAGIDHVGLGSDFDGVSCLPQGIDSVADLPKITQALLQRGYLVNDIQKILGGNLLRVFAEAERVSREMQKTPIANH